MLLPPAGTKTKKSHEVWPSNRTASTKAEKSHSARIAAPCPRRSNPRRSTFHGSQTLALSRSREGPSGQTSPCSFRLQADPHRRSQVDPRRGAFRPRADPAGARFRGALPARPSRRVRASSGRKARIVIEGPRRRAACTMGFPRDIGPCVSRATRRGSPELAFSRSRANGRAGSSTLRGQAAVHPS